MENIDGLNNSNSVIETQNDGVSDRPKLRKIKRRKVSPLNSQPIPPEKLYPDNLSDSLAQTRDVSSDDIARHDEDTKPQEMSTSLVKSSNSNTDISYSGNNPFSLSKNPTVTDFDFSDDDDDDDEISDDDDDDFLELKRIKRKFFLTGFVCLVIGVLAGSLLFSSDTNEVRGLEGVVLNKGVPAGRPRCGLTEKSQACILYVMNCYKQELTGKDFYKLAATLTGREEYMINTENMEYSNVKIKPGNFAQLSIPSLE